MYLPDAFYSSEYLNMRENRCKTCDKSNTCTFYDMIQCFREEENQRNMEIYKEKYHA